MMEEELGEDYEYDVEKIVGKRIQNDRVSSIFLFIFFQNAILESIINSTCAIK